MKSKSATRTSTLMGLAATVACMLTSEGEAQLVWDQEPDDVTDTDKLTISMNGQSRTTGVMLDSNWRWYHTEDWASCDSNTLDAATMEKCIVQGLDADAYKNTYGITVGSDSVTLKYANNQDGGSPAYGQRVFLTDMSTADGNGYQMFDVLGSSLSFTIDLSNVPAGINAAVYFAAMDQYGWQGATYSDGNVNQAGWTRGLGYCDAQCPTDMKYTQDAGWNTGTFESCCPEMDLLEANRLSAALTPHPCTNPEPFVCDSSVEECGEPCDGVGGDMNPFRREGPGHGIYDLLDVTKPITITTEFPVDPSGALTAIVQTYTDGDNSYTLNLTDHEMATQKAYFNETNVFASMGGVAQMGEGMKNGMVLTMSMWTGDLNWLDSCKKSGEYQTYDCASNSEFSDDSMWQAAFDSDGPGAWRGPVDFQTDNSVFATQDMTFTSPSIPEAFKTQSKLNCDYTPGAGDDDGTYDCGTTTYAFTVSDIKLTPL
mmetsp:Transcript_45969/g.127773  ORF Transcript_45969/g.127773 Transcript_45969/m.127773 type:complete len:485 (-) Transcript_45969:109-1563(-)|eukprot:CAMPEP_0119543356 /NCGR_PEP_ID=MMETSP1344-20130328/54073_1 /TAXON_ID=236787 /ORGANISM="Florenciella parvula, Strain CCMP2471" /LENGTH=484 /DNA_ID=CAMNT_0007587637 /DNA_START=264 /DNA_END=1718 /DNA_ORIENTATION=+